MPRISPYLLLSAGLFAACTSCTREIRDEDSDRITEAMRPEPHPDVIPEGVALSNEAPPLAPPDTHAAHVVNVPAQPLRSPAHAHRRHHGLRGSVRYHLEPRPGGSTPGLLP
ncbi:hypothetical protein [Vitiosangium sp. GDMCC 1.1324]|uniref:hypothetical protein n=1 Tax=Vitiosangium sp. (strain GDMCC 1.1324) TaxID=2138576 RepID=UPI000D3CDEF7|nr:hypothetical protein [Vitiosangium sp. GDMCC 1.1324]PTL83431.1 hypothetical protein DAT35_15785 [Vitiosangium sp. GDMCC 1.1324]